jgi:hypothetical protein
MTRPRPTSSGRHSHDSPETNTGRETQSRLARGQPRAVDAVTTRSRPTLRERDAVTARPRPTPYKQRISDSPETNPGRCSGRFLTPPTNSTDQLCKANRLNNSPPTKVQKVDRLTNSPSTNSLEDNPRRETWSRLARGQP